MEESERLSAALSGITAGIPSGISHSVLNARNEEAEAEIIAGAGNRGAVTISTNMAGRGVDIQLGEGVADWKGIFAAADNWREFAENPILWRLGSLSPGGIPCAC